MKKKIDKIFNVIYKVVVALLGLWVVYILSSTFLAPPPYEIHVVKPAVHTACPGDKFYYNSEVIVRRTPVTLMRTDTWFSEKLNANVVADRFSETEIFNWDSKVKTVIPRIKSAVVPRTTSEGSPMVPGNYRYIVNLNSWGVQVPASMSIQVTIPENCS